MIHAGFGNRRHGGEPPIELRFVDLFMILLSAFILMTALLSIFGNAAGDQAYAPQVLTQQVPEALAAKPYRVLLAASGGSGGYQWRLRGTLPEGLRLDETGVISGTPSRVEHARFGVSVTDQRGRSDSGVVEMAVLPAMPERTTEAAAIRMVAQIALPDATQDAPYRTDLRAAGGTAPYRWRSQQAMPRGLTLSSVGVLSGTPNVPDVGRPYTLRVTVTDAMGREAPQELRLWVLAAPPKWWSRVLWWASMAFWLWALWTGGPGLRTMWDEFTARRRMSTR